MLFEGFEVADVPTPRGPGVIEMSPKGSSVVW